MDKKVTLHATSSTTIKELMANTFSRRINAMILKHGGKVLLNGKEFLGNVTLSVGDKIQILIPERSTPYPLRTQLPIKIIFKNEDFIVLYKPSGIPCMPTHGHYDDNLLAGLAYLYPKEVCRIVTRLDKDTSGLILVALNGLTHFLLTGEIEKKYRAILTGVLSQKTEVDAPILSEPLVMKRKIDENGKPSKTIFTPISVKDGNTLCDVALLTGRTHQIRIHAAHIGHPVVGDTLYGNFSGEFNSGQQLKCVYLKFLNPYSKENMEFYIPESDDLNF